MDIIALPLSIYIIARNEADRIGRTIAAARQLTDDVVVVENGSTDDTVAVAQAGGARVVSHPWNGYGAQKRFAEEQCRHDWLLCLDADEVPTEALLTEIQQLFQTGEPLCAFHTMKLVEVYPGQTRPRPFAKRVNVVRLFDRRQGRTNVSAVHDRVDVPIGATIGQLRNICLHYSIRSLAHLIRKYDDYTTLAAATLPTKPSALLTLRLFTEFPQNFLRYYILHAHMTGGAYGFAVARIKANARWNRVVKMWEISTRGYINPQP